jgi:hypothetical protein
MLPGVALVAGRRFSLEDGDVHDGVAALNAERIGRAARIAADAVESEAHTRLGDVRDFPRPQRDVSIDP